MRGLLKYSSGHSFSPGQQLRYFSVQDQKAVIAGRGVLPNSGLTRPLTLKPVAGEVIEEIVDTVFLPLVRLGAAKAP
jgi:hypothetical protein